MENTTNWGWKPWANPLKKFLNVQSARSHRRETKARIRFYPFAQNGAESLTWERGWMVNMSSRKTNTIPSRSIKPGQTKSIARSSTSAYLPKTAGNSGNLKFLLARYLVFLCNSYRAKLCPPWSLLGRRGDIKKLELKKENAEFSGVLFFLPATISNGDINEKRYIRKKTC